MPKKKYAIAFAALVTFVMASGSSSYAHHCHRKTPPKACRKCCLHAEQEVSKDLLKRNCNRLEGIIPRRRTYEVSNYFLKSGGFDEVLGLPFYTESLDLFCNFENGIFDMDRFAAYQGSCKEGCDQQVPFKPLSEKK